MIMTLYFHRLQKKRICITSCSPTVLASAYIDMQKLTDKRDEMKHAHAEYLMNDAISAAACQA